MSEMSPQQPAWRRLYTDRWLGYPFRLAAAILLLPRRARRLHDLELELALRIEALERTIGDQAPSSTPDGSAPNPVLEHRPGFDGVRYLIDNPDVAGEQMDPLEHYLRFGRAELRAAFWTDGRSIAPVEGVTITDFLAQAHPALAQALVEEIFQGVLRRSPGAQGADIYPRRLREEGVALRDIVAELIARPEFPHPAAPAPVVVQTGIPPELIQLAQNLITDRMVRAGAMIRLPPGDPPPGAGMEDRMRSMLLTLSMLVDDEHTPVSSPRGISC